MNTRSRVLRGQIDSGSQKRIIVDDGMYQHGYVVKDFVVWATSNTGGDAECYLSLNETTVTSFDAGDNRQVGWAGQTIAPAANQFSFLDPSVTVVRDLYVRNISASGTANYMIVIEPVMLTEQQGLLTLVQERSQDDL